MTPPPLRIAVVGCGSAGPAAAVLLRRQGHEVVLFERAPDCKAVGAGFLLQPSGMDVLRELGILEPVLAHAARVTRLHVLESTGNTLLDLRYGEPRLLVCDRENRRLFHTDLDGNWIGEYATNLRRPCSVSILGEFCAVAELEARVTIIDKAGTPVSFLGDNPNKAQWAKFPIPPNEMSLGIFTAPHGLSFDMDGNLYVEDWNQTGRVTKLVKVH